MTMFIVQSLAGYPLAQFFEVPIVWPLTVCAALVFLIGAGAGAHGAVLARRMQFRELAIIDSGASLARLGGAVVSASMGLGVLSQVNRINLSILAQRDTAGQQRYVRKMLKVCALLSAPIYGVGFIVAPWIIPCLYGNEWTAVVPLFQIILIFAYSRGFMSILGTTLNALDKPQLNAAINWVLVPIAIPAFLVGIWWNGIQGIAIAVAVIMGVGAAGWFWLAASRVMQCSALFLVQPVLLPTVGAALAIGLTTLMPDDSAVSLGMQPIALLFIYGLILSVGSAGRIPKILFKFAQQYLD